MKKLMFLCLFLFIGANLSFGQVTSSTFKNAAYAATSSWNNVNLKCDKYAEALDSFLKANASKFDINSYAFYKLKESGGFDYIMHDDYKNGASPMSTNGVHIYAVIDGYVFDNHHPKGQLKSTWESKIDSRSGGFSSFDKSTIPDMQNY